MNRQAPKYHNTVQMFGNFEAVPFYVRHPSI